MTANCLQPDCTTTNTISRDCVEMSFIHWFIHSSAPRWYQSTTNFHAPAGTADFRFRSFIHDLRHHDQQDTFPTTWPDATSDIHRLRARSWHTQDCGSGTSNSTSPHRRTPWTSYTPSFSVPKIVIMWKRLNNPRGSRPPAPQDRDRLNGVPYAETGLGIHTEERKAPPRPPREDMEPRGLTRQP